jgi:hypothetical protein
MHSPPHRDLPGPSPALSGRHFVFERDSFSFANELIWEYRFDAVSGRTTFAPRVPKPAYAHRCFVLACAARQFFLHASFDPAVPPLSEADYQPLLRAVLARSQSQPSPQAGLVRFPGYAGLREFSRAHEGLLKTECGGAWRSYVLRSHWRMVFPISRSHQAATASRLRESIASKGTAVVHLVRFPKLTINHGMVLYNARAMEAGLVFDAYDPNVPAAPAWLGFNEATRTFHLPANSYWAGGELNVIEICRNWLF